MPNPHELALVVKALKDGLTNCVYWDRKSVNRVRNNRDLRGFTPKFIRSELIRLVKDGKVSVKQVHETRENWVIHYDYYYKSILPNEEFTNGIFVEMRLVDPDEPTFEFPVVALVNAHP